ncbi:hypothetical protein B0A49_09219 [Cryomyces minteri]|uniref:N-acetyltransferase domain-containing protein n=1 Tax=Cryomyces minteri TaxID=331657 RepID=A0A4V5NGL4_9PEZI|nr:hypothetical protein B0A49_09219 [Cryomyces minteri]
MSEFISFLPAPGDAISSYDRTLPFSGQGDSIPHTFVEAMSVREEVFVKEQKVPLENELDADDPRSYHWVVYASVGTSSSPSQETRESARDRHDTEKGQTKQEQARRKSSTATKLAVGTIRLVPPPHPPHPEPGTHHKIDNAEAPAPAIEGHGNHKTSMHDGREPYVKLGRLAVLAPFRGLGLARLLVNSALEWAAQNAETILPPPSPTSREQRKLAAGGDDADSGEDRWNGLVLVHAQTGVQKVWEKWGFVKDEGMGVWDEEGIDHVGMWRRVEVRTGDKRAP